MKVGSKRGRFAVIAVPYAWLLVFFLLPFLVVARISVSEMETTTIKDIVTWKDGAIAISAKLGNYLLLAQDDLYLRTYASSLLYAAVTTLLCLAIGGGVARADPHENAFAVRRELRSARLRVGG